MGESIDLKKKTAIYTRVSTDKEEQKMSFKSQSDYYQKYCNEKGYDLYEIYADEGITGTKKNRKRFIDMMNDAGLDIQRDSDTKRMIGFKKSERQPKFNYILMKDLTRFSRNINMVDTVRTLRSKKVYLIFEDMNLTTEKKDWELEFNLYLTFSQQESIDKSNKLRWAYERKKEMGTWHMSTPLFGYEYDSKKGEYIINAEEAKWVRKCFELYNSGSEGTKSIAGYLNSNKVKTRRGKEWRADGVKRLITNEKYIGRVIIGKLKNAEVTSETKTKQKAEEAEWRVIENGIPAIINEETFNKAQEILNNRVKQMPDGSKKGSREIKSIFYQKIKCSKCGSFFTRVKGSKMKNGEKIIEHNYFCLNRRSLGKHVCNMRGISHNVLIRELQQMIDSHKIKNLILKTTGESGFETNLFERALSEIKEQRKQANDKLTEIENEIEDILIKVDKLFDVILDSSERMKEATNRKIEQLESQREILENQKLNYSVASLDKKEREIKTYYESMIQLSKKRNLSVEELVEWIDRVEVHEGRNLRFYFNFPTTFRLEVDNEYGDSLLTTGMIRFDIKY